MVAFCEPPMLTQEKVVEIRVLARQGQSIRQIARELGCSRNTVRRYLREAGPLQYGPRVTRPTKLDTYKPYLTERVAQARPQWIPATVLLREIRERGYRGGLTQLKMWLAPMKRSSAAEPMVRFETAPGEQLQVDFTWVCKGHEGHWSMPNRLVSPKWIKTVLPFPSPYHSVLRLQGRRAVGACGLAAVCGCAFDP